MQLLRCLSVAISIGVLLPSAQAQPYKFGCHYFRQLAHPQGSTTMEDRELIDDIIARSDTFDILHYDIAIDVTDYYGQQIKASTTITFTPLMADQDFIRFELWELDVDSVNGPNGLLSFSNDGQTLRVELDSPPALGDTVMITVHYQGSPHRDPDWGGFYFESGYIYNLGIGLTTIPPNFGKVWYPCFDSFVERATYTYHVKSAGTYRAHCQGDLLGEVQLGGDTVIRTFSMDQPITTHLSAIAVADYQDTDFVHTGANGDVAVRLTAKPAQLAAMTAKFADIGAAIDACEYWYGPYAWGRVGYVLTTDGALEIPTNIAYPDFMPSQSLLDNRGLFTHELGHHWWGDMVTPHTQQDMWMKEGPAEYSSHLVEEWLGGEEAFISTVKDNQYYVLSQANLQDGGFQALSPMPDPYIYGLHTYYKGAAVMHNMRGYLGDTLFRQAMYGVQAAHPYETLDAAGFRDALEAATGYDLHPFFDDQVFTPGFSVFVVAAMSAQPSGGEWTVDLTIKQKLRGTLLFHHQVPLDITLVGMDGQRQDLTQTVDGEFTDIQVQSSFEPKMVVLNGHNRLNQARMDHEVTLVPGESFSSFLPHVQFKLYQDVIVDSTLVRIEHIWAAPDQAPLSWGIDQISSTHYWNVDGLWPEGTELHARMDYSGLAVTSLDHDLFGTDEEGALVVYRANTTMPWEIYPDQTLHMNGATNGVGNIDLDVLLKGQYAFAKGAGFAGIASYPERGSGSVACFPVPASDRLTVTGSSEGGTTAWFQVFTSQGKQVMRSARAVDGDFRVQLDISDLLPGDYVVQVMGVAGRKLGTAKFSVMR